jgi:isopropylmalate/homocitrate/citramalate synthase
MSTPSVDPMEQAPWWSDQWFVSPYNYDPELRAGMTLPPRLIIHDSTLRDGEQTPGVVLRRGEKLRIAQLLDSVGVERIEAGMPAVSEEDYAAIADIVQSGVKADVYAFARAMPADVDLCARSGAQGIVIEVPSGHLRLKYQYKWTEADVLARAIEAVSRAKQLGLKVVFFPFDAARASGPFYEELISRVWNEAHPDSVCVVDTVGATLPDALALMVRKVRRIIDGPIEVHTHNDFGMGVGGTLQAVMAGATVAHVCVNGLGERTGNAPLEEVAVASRALLDVDTGIDLTRMKELSLLVEETTGVTLARNKPVVGDLAFAREIGLGIELVKTQQRTVFPFIPSSVGMEPTVVIGKKSGVRSIAMKLEEWGLEATEDEMRSMLADVKQQAIDTGRPLTDDELRAIYVSTVPTAR